MYGNASAERREHQRSQGGCSGFVFFFQAEDGIRDYKVTGVQTCALPISGVARPLAAAQAAWKATARRTLRSSQARNRSRTRGLGSGSAAPSPCRFKSSSVDRKSVV